MAFPEVHESDAPPEVEALYARLRAGIGIPVVNLIWRHAATMPGVLPWMVEAAEPLLRSAEVRRRRDRMLALGQPEPFAGLAGAARLLPPDQRALLVTIIATYNRGNLTNLQVLNALREAIGGAATGGEALEPDPALPPMLPPLPPQPRLAALGSGQAAQIRALASFHHGIGEAIPSLYMHLALLPGLLVPMHAALAQLVEGGGLGALRSRMLAEAQEAVPRLRAGITVTRPFPEEHAATMLAALNAFAGGLIAEMGGIGAGFARALEAEG